MHNNAVWVSKERVFFLKIDNDVEEEGEEEEEQKKRRYKRKE
jgi:hypothetical protein